MLTNKPMKRLSINPDQVLMKYW